MSTTARSVRLKNEVSEAVDQISDICGRDANFIMREAIEEYVVHHGWLLRETRRRLEKLDSGQAQLVAHEDVVDSIVQRIGPA